jgi:hypothetical protein
LAATKAHTGSTRFEGYLVETITASTTRSDEQSRKVASMHPR